MRRRIIEVSTSHPSNIHTIKKWIAIYTTFRVVLSGTVEQQLEKVFRIQLRFWGHQDTKNKTKDSIMNDQYLGYILLLEKTLAAFYRETQKKERLSSISSMLEFMETHSEAHAERVEGHIRELPMPTLDARDIANYQNDLTKRVSASIDSGDDIRTILTLMSETEEGLGNFYKKVAAKLKEISDHYGKVAEIIGVLGNEEYDHRDLLARDRKRLFPD